MIINFPSLFWVNLPRLDLFVYSLSKKKFFEGSVCLAVLYLRAFVLKIFVFVEPVWSAIFENFDYF